MQQNKQPVFPRQVVSTAAYLFLTPKSGYNKAKPSYWTYSVEGESPAVDDLSICCRCIFSLL